MNPTIETLFTPITLGNLSLPNRLCMAPMGRGFCVEGVPAPELGTYYTKRIEGGAGLIFTEATTVDHPVASMSKGCPIIFGEQALAAWQGIVDEVHAGDGKIIIQLWHCGTMRESGPDHAKANIFNPTTLPMGPSGLYAKDKPGAIEMTKADIDDVIKAYVDGAINAKTLGFDGIEIHAAHGYLLDQFHWSDTNQRSDEYGGSLANRIRFTEEITRAIRAAVGEDYLITMRISQWKQQDYAAKVVNNPDELAQWLLPLCDAGVDVFNVSMRRYWDAEFEGSHLSFAGWVKKVTGKPTITVGSVGLDAVFHDSFAGVDSKVQNIDNLLTQFSNNEFDMVAVGRAMIANADWANKLQRGEHDSMVPFTARMLASL